MQEVLCWFYGGGSHSWFYRRDRGDRRQECQAGSYCNSLNVLENKVFRDEQRIPHFWSTAPIWTLINTSSLPQLCSPFQPAKSIPILQVPVRVSLAEDSFETSLNSHRTLGPWIVLRQCMLSVEYSAWRITDTQKIVSLACIVFLLSRL